MEELKNVTYIVKCADGSLYTGWSNHVKKRVEDHNAGRGAKYTKARRPVELVFVQTFGTKQQALQQETKIKKMSRPKKMELILSQANEIKNFIEI